MKILISLIAGLIFGYGLVLSGMSNPSKVQNFLDLLGAFDPSLIFVMLGAVLTTFVGYRLIWQKFERPLFAPEAEFQKQIKGEVDGWLVTGAVCFGVGWGLVGFCPGPALTSVTFGGLGALVFVVSMLVGLAIAKLLLKAVR